MMHGQKNIKKITKSLVLLAVVKTRLQTTQK